MRMASKVSLLLISLIFFLSQFLSYANKDDIEGFEVDLFPRDSYHSPSYNNTEDPFKSVRASISRSLDYARDSLSNDFSPNAASFDVIPNRGEYLMKISLGTPPRAMLATMDTGSDLIWIQCVPCMQCYKQKEPLFDPRTSSTYKRVACPSAQCNIAGINPCRSPICEYSISYADSSKTSGEIATETLTLDYSSSLPWKKGSLKLKNIIIGCGRRNVGIYSENSAGLIGLGPGKASLVNQMGEESSGKFSYCLLPISAGKDKKSRLNFGSKSVVSGAGVVTTPLIIRARSTYYFVTLTAITVNTKRIELPSSSSGGQGNIMIDTGSTLTLLPTNVYNELEKAVAEGINAKRVADPNKQLKLCYKIDPRLRIPTVTMNFQGGNLELDTLNVFTRVSLDIVCFTFAGTESYAQYGNIAQAGYRIGFDTVKMKVSFKKADCTKD